MRRKESPARGAKKGVDFSRALQVYYLYPQRGREYAEGFAQRPGMGCHGLKAPCAPRPPTEGHSGADAAALRYKRQERHGARPVQRRWHRAREIFRPSQGEARGRRFIFLPVFWALCCLPAQGFNVVSSVGRMAEILTGKTIAVDSLFYYIAGAAIIILTAVIAFGGIKKVSKWRMLCPDNTA